MENNLNAVSTLEGTSGALNESWLQVNRYALLVKTDDRSLRFVVFNKIVNLPNTAELVQKILALCKSPVRRSLLIESLLSSVQSERATSALVDMLIKRGLLIVTDQNRVIDDYIALLSMSARIDANDFEVSSMSNGLNFREHESLCIVGNKQLVDLLSVRLSMQGMSITKDECSTFGLLLVVATSADTQLQRDYNERFCKKVPILHATLGALGPIIGPMTHPYETACFECVYHRTLSNRPVEYRVAEESLLHIADFPEFSTTDAPILDMLSAMVYVELAKLEAGLSSALLFNRRITHALAAGTVKNENFLRLPRCPACAKIGTEAEPHRSVRDLA